MKNTKELPRCSLTHCHFITSNVKIHIHDEAYDSVFLFKHINGLITNYFPPEKIFIFNQACSIKDEDKSLFSYFIFV